MNSFPLAAATMLFLSSPAEAQSPTAATIAKSGMVACVCPIAAGVGVEVLKAGGNAVDAAVAVAFAEAVTWPEAGNIGGGGFMMVWPGASREPTCIDYRETAPAAATRVLLADGTVNWLNPKAVGVPGTVRGLELAHHKFGKRQWKELVAPAVKLASDGFVVDAALAKRLNGVLSDPKTTNAEFLRVYGRNGTRDPWRAGERLTLPDLAKTLRAIAAQGDAGFYAGESAKLLAAEMKAGGLITTADLAAYKAVERPVVRGTYRGYDIIGAPPPSSGGMTLVLALNMLEHFDIAKQPRQSAATIHLLAEVQRRAFAERAKALGDPDFTPIPAKLTTKEFAKSLAAGIDPAKATKSETLAPDIDIKDGDSTTHFSIIDASGMAVSNTYTLENSFGSRIVVRGAGYILNNEMTDFNPRPGVTARDGDIGTPPNLIAPGKRMLSSMCPLFVAQDGKLVLVTGSPGGRTIISTVMCVTVNVIDYKMPIQAAVDEPRSHHQWFPDRILLEQAKERPDLVRELQSLGHKFEGRVQGDAHSIWIDPATGLTHGAADRRLNGKALGY